MKLYRAAAFALAGWSLLLPPLSHTMRLDMTPDLSKWKVHSTHATAAECEQERQRLQTLIAPTPAANVGLRRVGRDIMATRYRSARCVSSEDPALQSKSNPANAAPNASPNTPQ
jgi:hypothetical protein